MLLLASWRTFVAAAGTDAAAKNWREAMMRFVALNRRTLLQLTGALAAGTALRPWRASAQDPSVLRVRSYSDLQVLDPLDRLAQPEGDIMDAIFSNLVKAKPGEVWDWQLDAAESIEQIDDTHIDFTLRKGIQFTGGFGELTADDVKYSFERIADPQNESPYRDDWVALDHVEVKDPYSGTIVLKEPFAPLWTISLVRASGSILSKKAMESVGGKFTTEPPAGSGPYVLKEWQPKQRTILARNPDFYGPAPDFDEVHVYPIEDEKTAEIAFEAGELDYTTISLSSLPELQANLPANAKIDERPAMSYVWLGMNVDNPALADIRVRQAIQKAVDVDAVLEAAYFGVAERSTGIIAPGLPGHRDIAPPKRDLEGAKALLDEAGAQNLALTLDILQQDRAHLRCPGDPGEPRRGRHRRDHPDARFRHLLDARRRECGRRLEGHPAARAALLDAARPELRDRLVHACADRRVELGALQQPGVRRAAREGNRRDRP